jgi:hypothetical protein
MYRTFPTCLDGTVGRSALGCGTGCASVGDIVVVRSTESTLDGGALSEFDAIWTFNGTLANAPAVAAAAALMISKNPSINAKELR